MEEIRKLDDEELEMVTGGLEGRLYDGIFDDPDDPYFTDDDPDALDPSTIFQCDYRSNEELWLLFYLFTRCDNWRRGRLYHSLWKQGSSPIADSDGFMYTFYCDLEKVMMIT